MTYQQKNNVVHVVQTILIGVCTSAAIGCFVFILKIYAFVATQEQLNGQIKNDIGTISVKSELLSTQEQNHETRISILENEVNKK